MKSTALFINNGRGPTVDEKALIKALEQGWIAGAGLDVLEQEPPEPENPLLHMENVILTPHIGSHTKETRKAMEETAVSNLLVHCKLSKEFDHKKKSKLELSLRENKVNIL